MPSVSTIYRHNHPEYALKEKEKTREYINKFLNHFFWKMKGKNKAINSIQHHHHWYI